MRISERFRRLLAPSTVVAVGIAWLVVAASDHRYLSFSDGVYTYLSKAVASKGPSSLYGELALSQPPIPVLFGSALWKLHGAIETIRIALAVLWIGTAVLTFRAARTIGLDRTWAAVAGILTIVAPFHAQFWGLDGEAFLAPLAVLLVTLLHRNHFGWAGIVVALGFAAKLTWLPIAIAVIAYVVVRNTVFWKRFVVAFGLTIVGEVAALELLGRWNPADIWHYLVVAQSNAGYQPEGLAVVGVVAFLIWLPLLIGALVYVRSHKHSHALTWVLCGSLACTLFSFKEGTFFNVLIPAEPLLALCAAAAVSQLVRKSALRPRIVGVVVLALCVSYVPLTLGLLPTSTTFPAGPQIVNTDNERLVDGAVHVVQEYAGKGDTVILNPFIAVAAERTLLRNQADWFILHADGTNDTWDHLVALAKSGNYVVSLDNNVTAFEPRLKTIKNSAQMRQIVSVNRAPLRVQIYAPLR